MGKYNVEIMEDEVVTEDASRALKTILDYENNELLACLACDNLRAWFKNNCKDYELFADAYYNDMLWENSGNKDMSEQAIILYTKTSEVVVVREYMSIVGKKYYCHFIKGSSTNCNNVFRVGDTVKYYDQEEIVYAEIINIIDNQFAQINPLKNNEKGNNRDEHIYYITLDSCMFE